MNISDDHIVQIDLDQEDDLKAPPKKTTTESSEVITITEDADYMETLALADSTDESDVDDVVANDVVVDITGGIEELSRPNKRKSSEINSSATIDISDDEAEANKTTPVLRETKKSKFSDSAGNEDDILEDFISSFNDELNENLKRS